jgi:hypothetical protein
MLAKFSATRYFWHAWLAALPHSTVKTEHYVTSNCHRGVCLEPHRIPSSVLNCEPFPFEAENVMGQEEPRGTERTRRVYKNRDFHRPTNKVYTPYCGPETQSKAITPTLHDFLATQLPTRDSLANLVQVPTLNKCPPPTPQRRKLGRNSAQVFKAAGIICRSPGTPTNGRNLFKCAQQNTQQCNTALPLTSLCKIHLESVCAHRRYSYSHSLTHGVNG